MIWESHFWKRDLLRDIDAIERWQHKPWSERQSVILEKKTMLSAYMIRKLVEARKLSDSLCAKRFAFKTYPSSGSLITSMNWQKIDRHFDLNRSTTKERTWKVLINQIIHSYIFMLCGDDEEVVSGFLVSSDQQKQSYLYGVTFLDFCGYARKVGENYPSWSK